MRKLARLSFVAAMALTLPWVTSAQHGGAAPAAAPAAPGAAPAAAPASAPAGTGHAATTTSGAVHSHHIAGRGTVTRPVAHGTTTAANPNVVVINPDALISFSDLTGQVPGLGFDYEFLANTQGNLAEKALIDPATQARLALLARFNRGPFAPEYFLWDYPYYGDADQSAAADPNAGDSQPQQSTPQIIIVQQPAPPNAPAAQNYSQGDPNVQGAPMAMARSPLTEASDFLLVLKDGVTVSAVAFTRKGDQLIYVTKEGNRRTMSMDSIDADATTKVNAARGTPLKLEL
jgi:hypothetical protein